ncbi:hypothetical protein WIW50_09855 [Flavobacteriaceae bacterium 3-367]|uniref:hypothetical protein n=1 Tax=Eudoraea algarum TaxID=3417568 RepID=UPI0032899703
MCLLFYSIVNDVDARRFASINQLKIKIMSREKEGRQKSGKTAPSSTPKEKKAAKRAKRNAKNRAE